MTHCKASVDLRSFASEGRTSSLSSWRIWSGCAQALGRTELVVVEHNGRTAAVSRPSLLAALVIKGAASGLLR